MSAAIEGVLIDIDGTMCGRVWSAQGGDIVAPVVEERYDLFDPPKKHIQPPGWENLELQFTLPLNRIVFGWVMDWWRQAPHQPPPPRTVRLTAYDSALKVVRRREFQRTSITEMTVSELNTGSSEPVLLKVTKENESSWIFGSRLTWANALRRVQHPAFFLVSSRPSSSKRYRRAARCAPRAPLRLGSRGTSAWTYLGLKSPRPPRSIRPPSNSPLSIPVSTAARWPCPARCPSPTSPWRSPSTWPQPGKRGLTTSWSWTCQSGGTLGLMARLHRR
jgi:hypothetical protein